MAFAASLDSLHAAATQMAGGLTDFGPRDYLPGLVKLLDAMDAQLQCTPVGEQFALGMIASTLAARLHTEQSWKQRPDYRNVAIRRPLIITGVPRTGTTALHKLLALDPQFQGLERWLLDAPQVRPPREQWAYQPAYLSCVPATSPKTSTPSRIIPAAWPSINRRTQT